MCSLVHLYNLKVLVEVFDVLKGQRHINSQCSRSPCMLQKKITFVNGLMTDAKGGYPQVSEFELIPLIQIP